MGKYFGTDGFRGESNKTLLAEHAYKIGRYLGWYLNEHKEKNNNERPRVLIGKDTRRSSYMFEYMIASGIISSGADAYILHVTTTPSVAYLVKADKFDCGVMISASHNKFYDNGIKLINNFGEKMPEDFILPLEDYLDNNLVVNNARIQELPYATRENIGKIVDYIAGRNRYIGYLISLGKYSFRNKKIGLDCANGSAWSIAKAVFDAIGATTYVINAEPNGLNINENCGSTHIENLQKYVIENNLDVGFAYDGDADRCFCVDEKGNIIDGDSILYICGKYMKEEKELEKNTVVTTIISNYGLYKAFDKLGIKYEQTNVGDKYVYECMNKNNYTLGGEQSGHIIFSKYASTGDGLLTSLKIMEVMLARELPLSKLVEGFERYPQLTINVKVKNKENILKNKNVLKSIDDAQSKLNNEGRVLVRPSGTEPVVRVMVEAKEQKICETLANLIVEEIKNNDI